MIICLALMVLSQINCLSTEFEETKAKRAVFDVIPSAKTIEEMDSIRSRCKGNRDEDSVCRKAGLASIAEDNELQVVERLERRNRRKNRRNLRRLFRQWLEEEIE